MKIKNLVVAICLLLSTLAFTQTASAQYYEIANRVQQLITPALSGSGSYKGFIEAGYSKT